jgi:phage FluMu protein Com
MVPTGDQCRCHCGSMLARMVRDGLELKCRKCKSLVLITHEELIEMYRELNPPAPGTPGAASRP